MAKPKDQKPAANWKEIFIAELMKAPNVTAAARKAKIHRSRAYAEKASDTEFAAAWESALESAIEDAEGEMWRRGVHGTLKPVFHQGQRCGSIREYSDTLLIFALKAHRPEKYRETVRNEHSGPDGKPLQVEQAVKPDLTKLSIDELLQLRQIVNKASDGVTNP